MKFLFAIILALTSVVAFADSDSSVYELEEHWRTQDGKTIELEDLEGRPQLMAMIYTNCPYMCPMIVSDLKTIEKALPEKVRNKIGIVLVSFDTDRDNPAQLKTFATKRNLPLDRWTLLTGSEDAVRSLSTILGVSYKKLYDGEFSHSAVITLLDKEGEIVYQQVGLKKSTDEIVKKTTALVK